MDINDIVLRSMDLVRDETPVGEWMNGISSYSLWWIFLQYDFYMSYGDYAYLLQQREYMTGLLSILCGYVGDDGAEKAFRRAALSTGRIPKMRMLSMQASRVCFSWQWSAEPLSVIRSANMRYLINAEKRLKSFRDTVFRRRL